MSIASRLEDAVQAFATWLLETPGVSHTVRLRIEAAQWRFGKTPRPIPKAAPKHGMTCIVIGVRPGSYITRGCGRPCGAEAMERRLD